MVFSAQSLRTIDALALSRYGLPTLLLMENAARALADHSLALLPASNPTAIILCGPGNNGGDGLAAARHLHNAGVRVAIALTSPQPRSPDAQFHLQVARRMNLPIHDASHDAPKAASDAAAAIGGACLIVDAMLGTGLVRPPEGPIRDLISWTNSVAETGLPVLAADIPSGLDADSGAPLDLAIHASATVTFAGLKLGFLSLSAQPFLGEVMVADIGVPRELLESHAQFFPTPSHLDALPPDVPSPASHGRRPGERD